jgi:CO/xanthine dehydrogenase FAD-binding subunit
MTMRLISNYHRPAQLDEALALLNREDVATVVIAGGTVLTATDLSAATEVVDIQSAVGAHIERQSDRVVYESMARLQDVIDHDATPPLLAELAHREGPNTLRNAATIGGTVAEANPESELLAGLLVHGAIATVTGRDGTADLLVADLLATPDGLSGSIITRISVEIGGETASARTGRTPADTPIVAAVGRIVPDGLKIALTGVATTPVLVDSGSLDELDPPGDFRGSSEYRKELARTLTDRVVAQLGGAS